MEVQRSVIGELVLNEFERGHNAEEATKISLVRKVKA